MTTLPIIAAVALRPLLKWPGGKHKIAPRIATFFPDGACAGAYYEPFLGGGSAFLHLASTGRVTRAELSDVNGGLINFHRVVRDAPTELIAAMDRLPCGPNWAEFYYGIREEYNTKGREGVAAAARLMWLNRTAFNGLYRENKSGGMNAPAGDYGTPNLPTPAHVLAVSRAFQGVSLHTRQFPQALAHCVKGDWLYVDPPYDPLTTSASFATYASGGFDYRAQGHLANLCAVGVNFGVHTVASNSGTVRMRTLWSAAGFTITDFDLKRSIGCTAASRAVKVTEIPAWAGAHVPRGAMCQAPGDSPAAH